MTTRVAPEEPAAAQATQPASTPAPIDHVAELLKKADNHFELGRHELTAGHLAKAKAQFNLALEVLLESPEGAKGNPRVREHFERLVDRIASLELTALATGDGFTEHPYEPASIDELLANSTFDTTTPTAQTTSNVQADLQQTTHDIPIPLNERVLRYVEVFQGRLREFLAAGLERGTEYLPMIQSVFRAEGLPLDLAYIPLIESAFKPTALSRAKAKGVWQFMSGTARENGLKHDWYIDERSDPRKATVAAAKYLKTLYSIFGDWHLAMASYNGGPGRVQRAMKRSGREDFWTLSANTRFLPRETREYVPMILAATIIAKNPAQYGFEVFASSARETELVRVPPAVDLRRVAEWAGVAAEEIQKLNPELRRWTTPIRGAGYELNVPAGSGENVRLQLAAASPTALNALQWYTVKRGDTLSTIARKLRVNRTDLAEANYLKVASRVAAGQKLLIPRMPSASLLARAATEMPGPTDSADTAVAEPEPDAEEDDENTTVTYRVRRGDTLSSIARRHGMTVASLKSLNNLRSSTLKIGARLLVQGSRTTAAQQN